MPSLRTICSGECRRLLVVIVHPVFLPDRRGNKTTPITNGPKIRGQARLAMATMERQVSDRALEEKYKQQIKDRDDAIERLKNMKARLSTKMGGETLAA